MKTAVYLIRSLTDLSMNNEFSDTFPELGESQGEVMMEESCGKFDIASCTMKDELRRILTDKGFPYVDYVFDDGHFSFSQAKLGSSLESLGESDEEDVSLSEEGWEEIVEAVKGLLTEEPQTLSIATPKATPSFEKVRVEREHLPVSREDDEKKSEKKMDATVSQSMGLEGSCLIFAVNYDDDRRFEAFDQILCQEDFEVEAYGGGSRGFCKITRIS